MAHGFAPFFSRHQRRQERCFWCTVGGSGAFRAAPRIVLSCGGRSFLVTFPEWCQRSLNQLQKEIVDFPIETWHPRELELQSEFCLQDFNMRSIRSIAVSNEDGHVFIVDWSDDSIKEFGETGEFVVRCPLRDERFLPVDICFLSQDNFVVCGIKSDEIISLIKFFLFHKLSPPPSSKFHSSLSLKLFFSLSFLHHHRQFPSLYICLFSDFIFPERNLQMASSSLRNEIKEAKKRLVVLQEDVEDFEKRPRERIERTKKSIEQLSIDCELNCSKVWQKIDALREEARMKAEELCDQTRQKMTEKQSKWRQSLEEKEELLEETEKWLIDLCHLLGDGNVDEDIVCGVEPLRAKLSWRHHKSFAPVEEGHFVVTFPEWCQRSLDQLQKEMVDFRDGPPKRIPPSGFEPGVDSFDCHQRRRRYFLPLFLSFFFLSFSFFSLFSFFLFFFLSLFLSFSFFFLSLFLSFSFSFSFSFFLFFLSFSFPFFLFFFLSLFLSFSFFLHCFTFSLYL
ncbi:unnamed protein product [Acanthosepion pharaonis]|uniref:Uncharacterized protein n=1 Tax=Acanthosepion pharaonis TaxID=158019 RepID=A0A812DGR3_ACAPH|nr:unnamed protein product [Sepia pharaonis]